MQENLQDVYNKDDENDLGKDKIFFDELTPHKWNKIKRFKYIF